MNLRVQLALASVRQLRKALPKLTEEELRASLQTESETLRRKFIFTMLINRLGDLHRQKFIHQLKETYLCPVQKASS